MTNQCQKTKSIKEDTENLIGFLNDSIQEVTNLLGEKSSKVVTLELNNIDLLLKLNSDEKEIIRLQKLANSYKKRIRGGGSITVITDTINIMDTIQIVKNGQNVYWPINDKDGWYSGKINLLPDSSTVLNIGFRNEYDVIIGYERVGLFKKEPFTLVTNLNPYATTKQIRSLKTTIPNKRFNLSITGGYGIGTSGLTPFIGLGVGYSILKF